MTFSGASLALGIAWKLLLVQSPSHHCWLSYKIHFLSHITIQSRNGLLLLHRVKDNGTIFLICGQLMRQKLLEFFHISPICFKCGMTKEWLRMMLSSLATSCVVLRRSASMTALNLSFSTSDGQPLQSSSSRLSSSLQNFVNHHHTVHSLYVHCTFLG